MKKTYKKFLIFFPLVISILAYSFYCGIELWVLRTNGLSWRPYITTGMLVITTIGLVIFCVTMSYRLLKGLKEQRKAMKILRSRIYEKMMQEQQDAISSERKSQVGSGDRSERIRTYNFPQSRISDHRIGLTLYKLEQFLNGDLDEVIDALIAADRAEKLKASSEE